jgi:hypothetical protein
MQLESIVAGAKILKRLSTEEVYAQKIRRLRSPDLLTSLLLEWVCESNDKCRFSYAWLAMHAITYLGNLSLPCGRPFSLSLASPVDGWWPAPVLWRTIETVMRVLALTHSYMDALVAGITVFTHLVQLQTPNLEDHTESSWARGHPGSRNPFLFEHSSGTMGPCPKAMASMMEGSLRGVEISLRRAVVSEEDKQKGELLQNMSTRLLDMPSPSGWRRIKDVAHIQHKWVYCPLGHFQTHFPALVTVRLIVRLDQRVNCYETL